MLNAEEKHRIADEIDWYVKHQQEAWARALAFFLKAEACNLGTCDEIRGLEDEEAKAVRKERMEAWSQATLEVRHDEVALYRLRARLRGRA
jgi:hypothetical protein